MEEWCSANIKDMYLFQSQPNTQSILSLLFCPLSEHFNRNLTPDALTPLTDHSPADICIVVESNVRSSGAYIPISR
jgi:hypothetical protein